MNLKSCCITPLLPSWLFCIYRVRKKQGYLHRRGIIWAQKTGWHLRHMLTKEVIQAQLTKLSTTYCQHYPESIYSSALEHNSKVGHPKAEEVVSSHGFLKRVIITPLSPLIFSKAEPDSIASGASQCLILNLVSKSLLISTRHTLSLPCPKGICYLSNTSNICWLGESNQRQKHNCLEFPSKFPLLLEK